MATEDDLLREQQAYYRARAPEYDQWFQREGRYDVGPDENRRWFLEVEIVRSALRQFGPQGRVLELAAGTGWWTQELVGFADHVTAVDGSPEALALNRSRLGADPKVEYLLRDLFHLKATATYDVVFFSFWLSHVPESRFAPFWDTVRTALVPGGRVFFVDSLAPSVPASVQPSRSPTDGMVELRRLNDGREFRVVKLFHEPERLRNVLRSLGWKAQVTPTGKYFFHGSAEPD